ncbi:MAG TPA: T9SS type A sorting domain-containing protein, partial [Bacteroidales bacterium]|nr:T9SS type A sorting domain-containing protein [Bacteroidales bacterium]
YWDGLGASYFTYYINDVPNATGYAPSLTTGWYEVSIMDEFGCRLDSTVYIDNLATFNISGTTSDELCSGNDGAIDISVDGAGPYTYWWSNNAVTEDLSGLSAGTYSVTVSDGVCADNFSFDISNEFDFTTNISVSNESCGDGTGSIDLFVSPYVTSTYNYLWSNGATTQDINGLNAGIYTCTVTRVSSGCVQIVSDTVFSVSSGLEIAANVISDSCSLGIGSCLITLSGGSGSYDYFWTHGPVSLSLSGMTAGSYSFTAIDLIDDCSTTEFIEIPDIRTFHASALITDATCATCNDGMIDVTVTDVPGYTNAYTYAWSHGTTMQDGVSLTPGIYSVTITSSSGCDTTMTFEVGYPYIVSIDEDNSVELQISPNPADRACVISWNLFDDDKGTIQITDMKGRKISVWKVSGENSKTLETALLAPGEYVVALTSGDKVIRKKLIVAR